MMSRSYDIPVVLKSLNENSLVLIKEHVQFLSRLCNIFWLGAVYT
jgi:hypothetical protein